MATANTARKKNQIIDLKSICSCEIKRKLYRDTLGKIAAFENS